jgi:hypothetical protein
LTQSTCLSANALVMATWLALPAPSKELL